MQTTHAGKVGHALRACRLSQLSTNNHLSKISAASRNREAIKIAGHPSLFDRQILAQIDHTSNPRQPANIRISTIRQQSARDLRPRAGEKTPFASPQFVSHGVFICESTRKEESEGNSVDMQIKRMRLSHHRGLSIPFPKVRRDPGRVRCIDGYLVQRPGTMGSDSGRCSHRNTERHSKWHGNSAWTAH